MLGDGRTSNACLEDADCGLCSLKLMCGNQCISRSEGYSEKLCLYSQNELTYCIITLNSYNKGSHVYIGEEVAVNASGTQPVYWLMSPMGLQACAAVPV